MPPINVQRQVLGERRHLTTASVIERRSSRLSWWKSKGKERRQSEPVINPLDTLHKKLEYLRQKHRQALSGKEEKEDIENRAERIQVNTECRKTVSKMFSIFLLQ